MKRNAVHALTMDHALHLYSGFVASMVSGDANAWSCCLGGWDGIDGVRVEVKVTRVRRGEVSVWDQVEVNGKHCGNRYGGLREMARLFSPVFAQIGARDAAKRAA